jgi:hypothetical protein
MTKATEVTAGQPGGTFTRQARAPSDKRSQPMAHALDS